MARRFRPRQCSAAMTSPDLDLRKVPLRVRRALGWILRPIKILETDSDALLVRPATVISRMNTAIKAEIDRSFTDDGPEGPFRAMIDLLASWDRDEWARSAIDLSARVRKTRRGVARKPGGRSFLKLIDDAHRSVRNGPLLVVPNPVSHGNAVLGTFARVIAAAGTRGEERARLSLDAAGAIVEGPYQSYLKALWTLADLADAHAPTSPAQLGKLVPALATRLNATYPGLVEPDAARVRNAVAHGHVKYLPRSPRGHAVELTNADGWSATLTIRDVVRLSERMLGFAAFVYPRTMTAFAEEAFLRPLLPVFPQLCRAIVADDRAEIDRVGGEFNSSTADLWTEIARL
jgi:hypothetical protein